VLWESQELDPHRIKTLNPIEIKFGGANYVDELTPRAKISYKSAEVGLFNK